MTTTLAPAEQLMTRAEAAAYLNLKIQTLAKWAVDGDGPRFIKRGHGFVRYRRAELDAWLEAGVVNHTGEAV